MASSMKIHFCDLCNESVPQSDIDHGRAVMRKGRIVCRACDRAMSHAEAHTTLPLEALPNPTAPRRAGGMSWIGVAALVFAAAGFVWLNRSLERVTARANSAEASLAASIERTRALEDRLDAVARANDEHSASLRGELDAARAETQAAIAESTAARTRHEAEAARLAGSLESLSATVRAQAQAIEHTTTELTARIARNEQDQQLSVERLSQLESGIAATAHERAPPTPNAPAWKFLLDDLASSNAGTRWQAVANLGDTKDPAVLPHLLPMLRDPDVFVRMATARVLGELHQMSSVGALIDALEDREAPVREAAYAALRAVSGKEHPFDPLAGEAEREKRVKAWRDWWKKQQEASPSNGSD